MLPTIHPQSLRLPPCGHIGLYSPNHYNPRGAGTSSSALVCGGYAPKPHGPGGVAQASKQPPPPAPLRARAPPENPTAQHAILNPQQRLSSRIARRGEQSHEPPGPAPWGGGIRLPSALVRSIVGGAVLPLRRERERERKSFIRRNPGDGRGPAPVRPLPPLPRSLAIGPPGARLYQAWQVRSECSLSHG
jgi:hypothetical protein